MQLFIQQIINGLMLGSMFALMSLGLSMMFGIMKTANFAYGALYMLGGYVAYWSISLLNLHIAFAIVLTFLFMFLIGVLVEVIGFRKFRYNEDATLIFGLGVALIVRGGAVIAWGSQSRFIPSSFDAIRIGSYIIPQVRLYASITSIILIVATYYIVSKTQWGRIIRAVSDNARRSALMGINANMQYCLVAGLATGLSAVACVLLAPIFILSPNVDDSALYTAMTIVILGGLGSIKGCAIGGLILGLITTLAYGYINSTIAPLFPLLTLIITLAVRPEGLFGQQGRGV